MDVLSGDIFTLVFKRVIMGNIGEFSLDSNMLSVLMELDGKKNLGGIAKKTGINIGPMRELVSKLLQLKLIEPVESAISILDRDFFDYLKAQLSQVTGPIAELLIEDAVSDLGHDLSKFPSHSAAELVDLLAREIQREEDSSSFKRDMVNKIKEKGYLRVSSQ